MSLIKINIKEMISEFLKDLEEASPNTRRSFYEIYPLCFKVSVKNHLPIYIELNKDVRKITFSSRKNLDFEINPELNDLIDIIFKKKITKQIILASKIFCKFYIFCRKKFSILVCHNNL